MFHTSDQQPPATCNALRRRSQHRCIQTNIMQFVEVMLYNGVTNTRRQEIYDKSSYIKTSVSSVAVISSFSTFSSFSSIAAPVALASLSSKVLAWVLLATVASVAVWGRVTPGGSVHGFVLRLVHGHVVITSLSSFSSLSSSHRVRRCWVGRFAYGLPVA